MPKITLDHFDIDGPPEMATPAGNAKPRFHRHKMTELMDMPTPTWLIRDLLFEQQIAVMCAPPGSFKSFLMLSVAGMLAHEMMWMGMKLKPRKIIYLAGEGFPLFGMRRQAWFKHHRKQIQDDGIEVVDGTVNLLDDDDVAAFINSAAEYDTDLLVIDTLSTSTAGEDENSSTVMTKAESNARRIGRALKCAVLIIHHPGKDVERGLRGHSSLGANADAVWILKRDGMRVRLETAKQKDGEANKVFYFEAHTVPLGIYDEDNMEISSLALTSCDAPADGQVEEEKQYADLKSIACAMKIGQSISASQLAKLMMTGFRCGERSAVTRINAAVPEVWTATRRVDREVELIRIPAARRGQAQKVQMRGFLGE